MQGARQTSSRWACARVPHPRVPGLLPIILCLGCLQGLTLLQLPAPINESSASVACTNEYGRKYYLDIQFSILAILIGTQVGSVDGGEGGEGEWRKIWLGWAGGLGSANVPRSSVG